MAMKARLLGVFLRSVSKAWPSRLNSASALAFSAAPACRSGWQLCASVLYRSLISSSDGSEDLLGSIPSARKASSRSCALMKSGLCHCLRQVKVELRLGHEARH